MKHLFRQTLTIQMATGQDRYGSPTFGSTINVPARVLRTHKRRAQLREGNAQVEDVIVELTAHVFNDDGNLDSLATGDKATYLGQPFRILSVYEGRDSFGVEQYKTLELTPWQT